MAERMWCAPRMGVCVFAEDMDDGTEFAGIGRERGYGAADEDPEEALLRVAGVYASGRDLWVSAGRSGGRWGRAEVCRVRPGSVLHVVGGSRMALRLRELLASGAAAGWELHPVQAGQTPLGVLAEPLFAVSGSVRFYNILARSDFCTVEELAATPEDCLRETYQVGPMMAAAVRQVLCDLGWESPVAARSAAGDAVAGRRAFIVARLAEEHRVRCHEFAGMLARSPLPLAALAKIAGSLSAETVPSADPLVCQLLDAAGEADLATYYQRTHARPVP